MEYVVLSMSYQNKEKKVVIAASLLVVTSQISLILETRKRLEIIEMQRVSKSRLKKVVREKIGEELWKKDDWDRRWKALEGAAKLCQ